MHVTPSLDAFLAHDGLESHGAVHVALLADSETPISVYRKLAAGKPRSFLLESVGGGEIMGRYSFIGCDVDETLSFADGVATIEGAETTQVPFTDPLDLVRDRLRGRSVWTPADLPRFFGGAVGFLGFDCVRYFEDLPLPPGRPHDLPEGVLLFTDSVFVYDHFSRRLLLIVQAPLDGDRAAAHAAAVARLTDAVRRLAETRLPPEDTWLLDQGAPPDLDVVPNRTPENMMAAVARAQEAIEAGEVFQVVVSQRFTVEADVPPFVLYRALRALNPSPYLFFFDFGDFAVVGASPEVLVRLEGDELLVRPIAGTRPRGRTREEDEANEADLLADTKELAEHRMLVDLGRNDVGRVAAIGSVQVDRPLHIERYSHVMHIVTDVHGRLREGLDCFDVFRAAFPAGTVSGAPKIRACELLAELEPDRRGLYAGAVGYFGHGGSMDVCIAIRTLLVENGRVHIQAGAGIVHDSVPASEHAECSHKARAGLAAVGSALARMQRGAL
jgi:anthranilate synthase component 1